MTASELKPGDVFFFYRGVFMYESEVVRTTDNAVNVKIRSFVAYPGVNDTVGRYLGFSWLPKRALFATKKELPINVFNLSGWVKL